MHTYDCTFHGLHEWHNKMFEKLGWMAMALDHHNKLKIDAYLDGINRLMECLKSKHDKTRDEDRRDDLMILLENTKCLRDCAHILLGGTHHQQSENGCISGKQHPATFHGLHHWLVYKFEKLGWMCLAKHHGHSLKINAYMDSIKNLRASLEKKLNELEEKDRKDDIQILHHNVCVLQRSAHKLLDGNVSHHHSNTYSRKSSKTKKHSSHSH